MRDLLELTARAEPTHFWFQGFRTYMAPVIRDIAAGRRDLRILDCGCGTGYNMQTLLAPWGRTFGFDLEQDAMWRARARGRPIVRANIQHIPFRSDSVDLATSFDVIQSVPDDRRALREIARVLRPGGHVVLNVTALDILRGDHSEVWGEQRRYNPDRAARLLADAGLEAVRISFLFASLLPLMLAVRRVQALRRTFRPPQGDADLAVPVAPVNGALAWLVRTEAALARRFRLPFGSSLLIVGRKP
ncbi:MAG: class I SAM-dependent methyltransferase [Acidobacteria bacterium]|nr:class I SAM-dependent methyltransferase [Acidobacteriota bacterium]